MSKITFSYRGVDGQGAPASGAVEAADKDDALRQLRLLEAQGLREIAIETAQVDGRTVTNGKAASPKPKHGKPLLLAVAAGVVVLLAAGLCRVYYGGGIGLRIVYKHSFSFKDTIVNLDDLIGQPRLVIAAQHPAVKQQLEEMGLIQSDEQVVVSAISGVTKAIGHAAGDTRIQTARAEIKGHLALALRMYQSDNSAFPTTEQGLQALLTEPAGAKRWRGPYIEQLLPDPWGRAYRYIAPGQHGAFDLFSVGPDGQEGTDDDVTNWK